MIKMILLLIATVACTHKYAGYDLIRKADFNKATFERPVASTKVFPTGKDEMSQCFSQWLFFSNAEQEKEASITPIVRSLCPRNEYLINTHMTETWWTTIIFTQSCVSFKTQCAEFRNYPR